MNKWTSAELQRRRTISVCHSSGVGSNLMTDVSLKRESTNSDCQIVANVITKDTAHSEQPPQTHPVMYTIQSVITS